MEIAMTAYEELCHLLYDYNQAFRKRDEKSLDKIMDDIDVAVKKLKSETNASLMMAVQHSLTLQ
jgi:hypothetical protein